MKIRTEVCVISENPPVFKEGWPPGVLAFQEIEFDATDMSDTMIAMGVLRSEEKFLDEIIEVKSTEITEE